MKIVIITHEGKEKKGFLLDRKNGTSNYLFLHFKTKVKLLENDTIINVEKGGCIIYTPNIQHWFFAEEEALIHDWVHFLTDDSDIFFSLDLPLNKVFYPADTQFITSDILKCEKENFNKDTFYSENVNAMLTSFFIKLKREVLGSKQDNMSRYMAQLHLSFKELRHNIYSNAETDWNVKKMADKMLLSRSRFSVLYKNFFTVSPNEDVIRAKMIRADYLLKNSNFTITEIAEILGYTSVFHFIRQCKKRTGLTPTQLRNQG